MDSKKILNTDYRYVFDFIILIYWTLSQTFEYWMI